MGRIVQEIRLDGRKVKAVFDTGSVDSFIAKRARVGACIPLKPPERTNLGTASQVCSASVSLRGRKARYSFLPKVLPNLPPMRDVDVTPDVLVGARAMQDWGVKLDPRSKRVIWPRAKPQGMGPLLVVKSRRR